MSILGPVSVLSASQQKSYFELDFSNGYPDERLSYTRSSNHGVWDREGRYKVVGPNVPPITWVPEVQRYALALEPSDLNHCTIGGAGSFLQKTLGYSLVTTGDLAEMEAKSTFTDAPDGSITALRIQSQRTVAIGPIASFNTATNSARVKFFIRKRPGIGANTLPIMLRNGTTSVVYGAASIDLNAGTGNTPDTDVQHLRITRRINGWLEIDFVRKSGFSPGDNVQFYMHGNSAVDLRADYWYMNLSSNPTISSFIMPSTTSVARTGYLSETGLVIPASGGNQFDWFLDGFIDTGPWAIPNGAIHFSLNPGATTARTDVLSSSASSYNFYHQNASGTRVTVSAVSGVGSAIWTGRRPIRGVVRSSNGTAYGSAGGKEQQSLVTYSDLSAQPAVNLFRCGSYNPNVVSAFLHRTAVYPVGTIQDLAVASKL